MKKAIGLAALAVTAVVMSACATSSSPPKVSVSTPRASSSAIVASPARPSAMATQRGPFADPIPGMPPIPAGGVYSDDTRVSASIASDPAYVYVPDSSEFSGGTTTVIDQNTHKIVRVLHSGVLSQHVTPSWDLKHIYVESSVANHLYSIDEKTGRGVGAFPIERPYNLYFTPDGRYAVEMDEEHQKIQFADPHNFHVVKAVSNPTCVGPNHADFSANGRYFIVSCEFSGSLLKIDTLTQKVVGTLTLPRPASCPAQTKLVPMGCPQPQDVRLAPDGRNFFVADMGRNLLLRIPWNRFTIARSYRTMSMPHGIYFSRNQKVMYLTARGAGAVQIFNLKAKKFVNTWQLPQPLHLDMGGLSADGKTLWLSARNEGYVVAFNTATGKVVATVHVGGTPHGLLVWPQAGRYSLGHTGLMR